MIYFKWDTQDAQRVGIEKAQHLSKEQGAGLAEASGTGKGIHLGRALSAKLRHLDFVW